MKVTTLIENHSCKENILPQYGLSLLIQTKSGTFVLDAGQDESALLNFQNLGYSSNIIDAIVVSHNHFDHIGGLQFFADATEDRNIPIYVSSGCGKDLYTKQFLRRRRLVSRNDLIEKNNHRIVRVDDQLEILPSVFLCRVMHPRMEFLCRDRKLRMMDDNGMLVPDDFCHELYVAVVEDGGVKILSSCSHNGIVNISEDAQNRFNLPILAFVGGLHLRGERSRSLNCTKTHADLIFQQMNHFRIKKVYTCHCTGVAAMERMKTVFHGTVQTFCGGEEFEV